MSASIAMLLRRMAYLLILLLLVPLPPFASETFGGMPRFNQPLGEVRGTSPAQVSFDGRTWTSLGSSTLPVFDRTLIRARSGIIALTFPDGSRLEASPTTELAISRTASHTNVLVAQGNVLFRMRPSARIRLAIPGGVIQTDNVGTSSMARPVPTRVSDGLQGKKDTWGVVTVQKSGLPRVRLFSGEATLVSRDGSVTDRLREGQSRTLLAQSSGPFPLKQMADAQLDTPGVLPPTDPPSNVPEEGFQWGYNPSNPAATQGGWRDIRIGPPPGTPPRPDQEVRRGFVWAWEVPVAQWVIVRRECRGVPAFFVRTSSNRDTLPPLTDPPGEAPPSAQVWAWNASNPQNVLGGWQQATLGKEPESPPRLEQELRDGFVYAWNEPKTRWDVVEECDLAAAFLVPAGPGLVALLGAGAGVGAVSVPAAVLTGGGPGPSPNASNFSPS
jgi:hypothetical protein